jgi:hypothetical protein
LRSLATQPTPGILHPTRSATHKLALALVWLTAAFGFLVFSEPAPVDVLMAGLIVVLPVIGLVRITDTLIVYVAVWLVAAACAFLAAIFAIETDKALIHTTVSLFLYLGSFVLAAFIAKRPEGHTKLVLNGYLWAAMAAAVLGTIGYFDIVPGTQEYLTKFGRATATFKDPNVFGPFLVPAFIYALHRLLNRPFGRAMLPLGLLGVLGFALLLSFSRGAWLNLAISLSVFCYLTFVTAPTNWLRVKLLSFLTMGAFGAFLLIAVALQFDAVSDLMSQRASLTHSYDEGPEGRFGGQAKARRLILENPLGIGAQQFAPHHHLEEPHNVYLAMFLNAGWIGGLVFLTMVALTGLYGLRHAFRRTATQPLFLIAYAAFMGHVIEGAVIDLDHWRHFYVLIALIWGLMIGDRKILARGAMDDPRSIFGAPAMIVPRRPARALRPQHRRIIPVEAPRRVRPREIASDNDDFPLPARAAGRAVFGKRR